MIEIEWSTLAFSQLEALTSALAFQIVQRVELLASFPEMGAPLKTPYRTRHKYRQLIVQRRHRVIYRYDGKNAMVYVLTVQHCRQQLPSGADLRRMTD
jgi:plasmid stabilization system protein ParE